MICGFAFLMKNQTVNIKLELERINCGLVNWKGTKQEL